MVTTTDNFVTVDGARLHYTEYGTAGAPALLCLHGFMGHAHNWDRFAQCLAGRFRLLALTARGHGDSDRTKPNADMFEPVRDAASFLDALGVASAVVVGHSMGASIGGGLAVLYPDKVSKLVLGDTGPDADPEGAERLYRIMCEWQHEFDNFEAAERFFLRFEGLDPRDRHTWAKYGVSRDPDGKFRMKLDRALVEARRAEGVSVLPSGESPLWQFVPQIKCPTLIVRGSRTVFFPRPCADRMVEIMPDARLVEIDTGHLLFLEDLDAFYEAIKEFLEA